MGMWTSRSFIGLLFMDHSEKGERTLADFLKVEWKEYFPVFNIFTNLYNKDGLKILEDCLKKRKIGSHYFGALSSCDMTLKDQIIAVIEHYPPHVNPLNHVVNQLLAVCNKSMQVHIFEGDKLIIPLSSLPEFPTPPQSLDAVATPEFSSSTVFLNGSSYSNLDTEVFIAIKDLDIPLTVYPEICKWKSSMAAYLRRKYNIIHL
ncbi:ankyrin repeat and LEM domain-containing protein 2 [Trichonephila inaurata madagascariensis]|uniref:Ankyrin repeat and LEM domain-containing protein 2 n=1 Tax=Trichonephila inaurata madagascariensis TaxID=2747483 RepID=A0A8X6K0C9_9ARAC|nr:ankyrin repeat and LEM domain-containing protein 2 [Trichonephila inaurata madagascariensis]